MLQFTQEEVEEKLAGLLGRVTRKDIARVSQLSESYIKKQLNPNDDQASCMFRALQIFCGMDDLDSEIGAEFWLAFVSFRTLSLPRVSDAECNASPFDCLSQKLQLDGKLGAMITDALKDGALDKKEILALQRLVKLIRGTCDMFDQMLNTEIRKLGAGK